MSKPQTKKEMMAEINELEKTIKTLKGQIEDNLFINFDNESFQIGGFTVSERNKNEFYVENYEGYVKELHKSALHNFLKNLFKEGEE